MADLVAQKKHQRRALTILGVLIGAPLVLHATVLLTTKMAPPALVLPTDAELPRREALGVRHVGPGYVRTRAGVREVYLEGSPEALGAEHSRLLYEPMVENENVLWKQFAHFVPLGFARTLLMDLSRARYRHVDEGMPDPQRREVAAQAEAFTPDPFASHLPAYHRMVFLHALYDIALSFEHSPLIGCSSFVLGPGATQDGHTLLGRAFDFEAGDIFDREKAVFFVRGRGKGVIPFASVAWPGLVGVLSGMNAEGVALVVHGGRAGEPRTTGEPVVMTLRDVLEQAHDTDEAVALLKKQEVMVSHLVMVADARGKTAIVERAPGVPAFVRPAAPDPDRVAMTNHFEGPLKDDRKNLEVRAHTTTLPRRTRLDEMLLGVGAKSGSVASAVAMLRDHQCEGGEACPLGDRRAIDALIATHGIVADTTAQVLWVSAGPHLSGHFVRFDLKAIFAHAEDPGYDLARDPPPETLGDDPILHDGRYEAGRERAGGPRLGGDAR